MFLEIGLSLGRIPFELNNKYIVCTCELLVNSLLTGLLASGRRLSDLIFSRIIG